MIILNQITKEKAKQIIDKAKKLAGISGKKFNNSEFLKLNDFLENANLDFIENEDEFEILRGFLEFSASAKSFSTTEFLKNFVSKEK